MPQATTCAAFHADARDQLARVLAAARDNQTARGLVLVSHDPEAALMMARDVATAAGVPAYTMSMALRELFRPGASAADQIAGPAADPLEVFRSAGEINGPAVVLLRDMLHFVDDATGDPRARAFLLRLLGADYRRPHVYAFCEPPEGEAHVPSFARALLGRVTMPLPRGPELLALAKEELAVAAALADRALTGEVLTAWARRLAAHLPGLSSVAARFAIQDGLGGRFDLDGAVESLAARKAAHLQRELAMEVLQPSAHPPVGMERFYRWLRVHRDRMCVPGPDRVKGAVLVGPPGTGKTRLGAYAASALRVGAVWFRFGALLGKYVGQSEANAERAFAVLDALGTGADSDHERGMVVLLDELEKTIGHGDTDGGVTRRVLSRMLTWMSESTAPNMILATANELECMGELADIITRPGRLNRIFFVDVPNRRGRMELFQRLLPGQADQAVDLAGLAERSDRFTGADIEAAVRDAAAEARAERVPLETRHVVAQIELNRVQVLARYERFNRLREWARANAVPAGDPD